MTVCFCLQTLEAALVGYLEPDAVKLLFQLDKRLRRVLQRNFLKTVLDSVRSVVPMLSEMEDKGYVVLSTLINLKYFEKDDIIYQKGSSSDYSYIVMRGLIKVRGMTFNYVVSLTLSVSLSFSLFIGTW